MEDDDAIDTKTCWQRAYGVIVAALLVVMLAFGAEPPGLLAEAIDYDGVETISVAETHSTARVVPRTKERSAKPARSAPRAAVAAPHKARIAPEGQVAFALPNGGIVRPLEPTGPPSGRV
jgi:hypothetical protein